MEALQSQAFSTAEKSTLLSRPGSKDAAPSSGRAAHPRARLWTVLKTNRSKDWTWSSHGREQNTHHTAAQETLIEKVKLGDNR